MKKVYIPSEEELYSLQSLGANVYKYMLIRVIEALITEDVMYDEHDMLEFAYDNLSEFPEIVQAICKLYPERIPGCERALKDIRLCHSLIEELPETNRKIYGLDNLVQFGENEDILFDNRIVLTTAKQLAENILQCPKYRFDYKEPNILLDSIFACELPHSSILPEATNHLIAIDPIYAIKLTEPQTIKKDREKIVSYLTRNILKYSNRYGLNPYTGEEYHGKDILSNPDERVKKLRRCLEYHKTNYQ